MMEEDEDMKAIIVTTQNAINYGAVLQSYAFHEFLNECEIDNCFLNIRRVSSVYFRKLKFNSSLPGQMYDFFWRVICFPQILRKVNKFEKFVTDHVCLSRLYKSMQSVIDDPPKADLFITGGDQMFNASTGIRPVHFLDFEAKNTMRVSYSTSMGVHEIPSEYLEEFKRLLNRYRYLSLREECAVDYLAKICNVPCRANMDPVFLLTREKWNRIIDEKTKGKPERYILVYSLLYNASLNPVVKRLALITGLPIKVISNTARNYVYGNKVIRDAGPIDFLRYFRDAEYVITNSFHGTCFSIIFEKKFYSLIKECGEVRINSLLSKLGIEDRIIHDPSEVSTNEICFERCREVISKERDRAREYIKEIIHE